MIIIIINFFFIKQTRSYHGQKPSLPLSSGAKLLMHIISYEYVMHN